MATYGVFRGRFQPFHVGHVEVCKQIANKHSMLVIGIVVVKIDPSTEDEKLAVDDRARASISESFKRENNPFPFVDTYTMVNLGLLDAQIERERVIIVPHFTPLFYPDCMEMLCMPPKNDAVLYIPVNSPHNEASVEVYKSRGWNVVRLETHPNRFSGTFLRERLRSGQSTDEWLTRSVSDFIRHRAQLFGETHVSDIE